MSKKKDKSNNYSLKVRFIKFLMPYYEPKPKTKPKTQKKTKNKKIRMSLFSRLKEKMKKSRDNNIEDVNNEEVIDDDKKDMNESNKEKDEKNKDEENKDKKIQESQENTNNDKSQKEFKDEDANENKNQKEQERENDQEQESKEDVHNKDQKESKNKDKDVSQNEKTQTSRQQKSKEKVKNKRHSEFDIPVMQTLNNKTPFISLADEKLLMAVLNYPKSLDNAIKLKTKPKKNRIWVYHDKDRHQLFAHLDVRSGFKCKTRNDELRRNMIPWIKPKVKKKYDRTHVLPIGYHGSDGDPRLIIGWDSEHNQNELKNFEFRNKKRDEPIYWFTDIRKDKYGATWSYKIYSVKTKKLIDSLTLRMDKTQFMWRK